MKLFSRRPRKIPRRSAMGARPVRLPFLRREDEEGGKTRITVTVPAPGWLHLVGGPKQIERTLRLDPLGMEVYNACDGKTDVETMVERFVKKHRVGRAEAEVAVTTFLKTLIAKGLVAVEVDREPK